MSHYVVNVKEQERWNTVVGPAWTAVAEVMDHHLRAFGLAAMDAVTIARGARVLDVGCGGGETTFELARRVGPNGTVLGLDLSVVMLERARRLLALDPAANVAFREGDAEVADLGTERFDLVYSRFGVMFFANPVGAFENLRRSLRPAGQLTFVCWGPPAGNVYLGLPRTVAKKFGWQLPELPERPGPHAFGDGEHVRTMLERAGYHGVAVESRDVHVDIGGGHVSIADAASMLTHTGPLRDLLQADPSIRPAVIDRLVDALRPYRHTGGVTLPASINLVHAAVSATDHQSAP